MFLFPSDDQEYALYILVALITLLSVLVISWIEHLYASSSIAALEEMKRESEQNSVRADIQTTNKQTYVQTNRGNEL